MTAKRFLFILPIVVIFASSCRKAEPPAPGPDGPRYKLSDFQTAQSCSTCHPQHYDEWSGSMHHYAANDPIWMLANNGLQASTQGRLKSWCFQCHSPIGFLTGNSPPTFQFSDLPAIVREGVNCDVCHTLRPPHTTTNQTIQYNIEPGRVKYGPIADPVPNVFHESRYDPSFTRSEVCRTCHDLIINGVPTEITFTEWQNSPWGAMSVECQHCHMPRYTGRAAVGGPVRDNLTRHDFIGVDVAITDFPNKPEQRAAIDSLLKNSASMTLQSPATANLNDSIQLAVTVYNDKTGHNLPTGVFFNRQMWIEVTVWNGADTIYRSGHLDANGDLMDTNSVHHTNEDKDLTLFGGRLYKNGQFSNVFELDSLVNNSIPPFGSRTALYRFRVPAVGVWNVRVRLLFRPFGPYLFRAVGADQYITQLPIFEMIRNQAVIDVR